MFTEITPMESITISVAHGKVSYGTVERIFSKLDDKHIEMLWSTIHAANTKKASEAMELREYADSIE